MFSFGEVLSRESFLFLLDLEIKKARRYRNYISLLSLTFGHRIPPPGENPSVSLKTLAHLIKDELRDTDIRGPGRRGNQLLVMLPYADKEAAHRVGERLEKSLQEYGFGKKKGSQFKSVRSVFRLMPQTLMTFSKWLETICELSSEQSLKANYSRISPQLGYEILYTHKKRGQK